MPLNIFVPLHVAESFTDTWGAKAIISSAFWPEVVQIAKAGAKTDIPIISLVTTQPLAVVPRANLFKMPSMAPGYVQCLVDLIKFINWREVNILYEDDDYGSTSASLIPQLTDALLAVGSEITGHIAFLLLNSLSNSEGIMHRELERLKPRLCKVFIIVRWLSPSLAMELFKEAVALGMMAEGYVWIAGDDITTLLDSTFTPSFISSYMQGFIGTKTYLH